MPLSTGKARKQGNIKHQGTLDSVQATKGGRGVVILSNKGLID
jgi:hypothetical protein